MKVQRHLTAIQRNQLSRPVLVALRDEMLTKSDSFFDYGCGRGQDLEYLGEMGFKASGWDPAHAPASLKSKADIVNLGYVINVIEDPKERAQVLKEAFKLAKKALIVSAMIGFRDRGRSEVHNDGVLTQRGTFQKYFEQDELEKFISTALKRDAYPAALGVFYVFAQSELEESYCQSLAREASLQETGSAASAVRVQPDDLAAIAARVLGDRQLPAPSEMPDQSLALGILASSDDWLARLSANIQKEDIATLRRERREAILLKISTSFYGPEGGARLSDLSLTDRADVRAVFGSMARAQREVERYLRSTLRQLESECRGWGLGKLTPSSLYLHVSLTPKLPFNLRLVCDCARELAGESLTGDENILKINFKTSGVSFATYRDFESEPHPALARALRVDFATSTVSGRDYAESASPPILHRKELFVDSNHAQHAAWTRFTQMEEELGLLGRRDIGTLGSWQRFLARKGVRIEDGALTQGEPYEVEVEQAEVGSEDEDFEVPVGKKPRPRKRARSRAFVWPEAALDQLGQALMSLGRPPLTSEIDLNEKILKRFLKADDWAGLLGERFDPDLFEHRRRERWKHWVVYLGGTRFGVAGRPKLKQLDSSARADIKCFFNSYRQASAEADHWLMQIGQEHEVTNAINTWPHGFHHAEKGLYVHASLVPELPVVLRLLLVCGRFMAGRSMLEKVTVARISIDGRNVKFYEYESFDKPEPARRLQSVKVDFRRRRVIPRDYFNPPRFLLLRSQMLPPGDPTIQELAAFEAEVRQKLAEQALGNETNPPSR